MFPALARTGDLWVLGNAALDPAVAAALAAHVEASGSQKVGDNGGQETALDPCPWPEDHVCDEPGSFDQGVHTGLCSADSADCASGP